jgi:7-cyano-7-deazaguanine synthase
MSSKAVVLLSGGLDSTTVLAIAKTQNREIYALTFQYGQRHDVEVEAARKIGKLFQVNHHQFISIDLRAFGHSSLTAQIAVPKNRNEQEMEEGIPNTYVPARNTIFLSYALAYAEVNDADSIYIGVNALDYSGYPDCRPEFIHAFNEVARLGIKRGVEGHPVQIKTPIINLTKKEIIEIGINLGVDYSLTYSCYDPIDGLACGACDSCQIRRKAFLLTGIKDPTLYHQSVSKAKS